MRQVARYTAVILLTLLFVLLTWQFRLVLLLIILSLIIAAAVRPLIVALTKWGFNATAAQIIIYTFGLFVVALAVVAYIRPLAMEIGQLTNWLIVEHERIYAAWLFADEEWKVTLADRIPNPDALYASLLGDEGQLLFRASFGLAQGIATVVGGFLFALVLSIYWSVDQGHFERFWLSFLSVKDRVPARNGWRKIEEEIGRFVLTETTLSVLAAVVLGVGYWVIDIDFPILLGIVGGLSWLIPMIGIFIIGTFVVVVGLILNPTVAIVSLIYTLVIFGLFTFYLEPKLHGRNRYSFITLILVMIPLVRTLGILGFVIAPPIAILLQLVLAGVVRYRNRSNKTVVQLAELEERFYALRDSSKQGDEDNHPPEIENILNRLEKVIKKAHAVIPEAANSK